MEGSALLGSHGRQEYQCPSPQNVREAVARNWREGVDTSGLPCLVAAGCRGVAPVSIILLVEGGPDILAAHHFAFAHRRQADAAVVGMLGAANKIPDDASCIPREAGPDYGPCGRGRNPRGEDLAKSTADCWSRG